MKKKIFRSRDVIFYEDQTILDCERLKRLKLSVMVLLILQLFIFLCSVL